jgi:nucleoside phosphorylase
MGVRATALICTALGLETEAVAGALGEVRETFFSRDRWPVGHLSGRIDWDVVIVETGAENNVATARVESALSVIKPSVVVFVGIAGGFAAHGVHTLDLIVPARVHQYGAGRAKDKLDRRHRDHEPTPRLLHLAKSVDREDRWRNRLSDPALVDPIPPQSQPKRTIGNRSGGLVGRAQTMLTGRRPIASVPSRRVKVFFEPLASGDHVVKSLESETYRNIREDYDQAVGVDMEAAGFLTAAAQHEEVLRLVVRGVSDLLSDKDITKETDNQPRAARIASAFALEVLAQIPADQLVRPGSAVPKAPERHDRERHTSSAGHSAASEPVNRPASRAAELLGDGSLSPADAALLSQVEEWAEIVDLVAWGHRTEGLFLSYQPRLPVRFVHALQTARSWLGSRVHPAGASSEVGDALTNFHRTVTAFLRVFDLDLDVDEHFAKVARFDRQHGASIQERMQLDRQYEHHVRVIQNLGLELTRAANLVCERARRDLDPMLRVKEGKVQVAVGPDGYLEVVDFTEEEREQPIPFPEALDDFLDSLPSRAGAYLGDDGEDTIEERLLTPRQLSVSAWTDRDGVSAGEDSDAGRAIQARDEDLVIWVANRTGYPLRLGEASLEVGERLTHCPRPMHRIVQPGHQVAYAIRFAHTWSGAARLTVQQERYGGRLLKDAKLTLHLEGENGGAFDEVDRPPLGSTTPDEPKEQAPPQRQPERVARPRRRAGSLHERLQRELDEGVRLLNRCPASTMAVSVSANLLGSTTEQDVTGWEARVERLLRNQPRLLSQFRYAGKPKTPLMGLMVGRQLGGGQKRRLEQKVANLDKVLRDNPYLA